MALTIPDQAKEPLKRLLALSRDLRHELIASVRATKPMLHIPAWASAVAERFGNDKKTIEEILWAIAGLYLVRSEDPAYSVESLVADVRRAAEKSGDEDLARSAAWDALTPDLIALLSENDTLGVTAKAIGVMMHVERNFQTARVITDMRPIFGYGSDVPPRGAVIVHNLVISHQQNGETSDIVFGLDAKDIQTLQSALERASRKEASLKELMARVELPILEPK